MLGYVWENISKVTPLRPGPLAPPGELEASPARPLSSESSKSIMVSSSLFYIHLVREDSAGFSGLRAFLRPLLISIYLNLLPFASFERMMHPHEDALFYRT